MAGTIQTPEGRHGLGTNMFVPQNPQGEEDNRPGRNCSGFEDTQDLETAVCPPLLPMAPCSSQVCLCSEGKDSCDFKHGPPPQLLTLNKIPCLLVEFRSHILFISFFSGGGPTPTYAYLPVFRKPGNRICSLFDCVSSVYLLFCQAGIPICI